MAVRFTVEWFADKIIKEIERRQAAGMEAAGAVVASEARERCPIDTGRLRRSIQPGRPEKLGPDSWRVEVGTNVEYAPYVEFGTKAHVITPKRKKALYWKGAEHPVKVVQHPGTQPRPYLFPALEAKKDEVVRVLRRAFEI